MLEACGDFGKVQGSAAKGLSGWYKVGFRLGIKSIWGWCSGDLVKNWANKGARLLGIAWLIGGYYVDLRSELSHPRTQSNPGIGKDAPPLEMPQTPKPRNPKNRPHIASQYSPKRLVE